MKSKWILVAILLMSLLSLAVISTVAAVVDYSSNLEVTKRGDVVVVMTWPTVDPVEGVGYSGRDIETITVEYHFTENGVTTVYTVIPTAMILKPTSVTLIFNPLTEWPDTTNTNLDDDQTYVHGTLTTGETFDAYGAGFGWANIH